MNWWWTVMRLLFGRSNYYRPRGHFGVHWPIYAYILLVVLVLAMITFLYHKSVH